MNLKLILKTIFLIAILSLLVLLGMYNRQDVKLWLPPVIAKVGKTSKAIEQEAAIMYFGFFAVGVVTGTILTAGGGKKGSKTSKVEK